VLDCEAEQVWEGWLYRRDDEDLVREELRPQLEKGVVENE